MRKSAKLIALTALTLSSKTAFASDALNTDEDMQMLASRSVSQVVLLSKEEESAIRLIFQDLSSEHLQEYRDRLEVNFKSLLDAYNETMEKRDKSLISWSAFHEKFAGKARAIGWGCLGAGVVGNTLSSFFATCGINYAALACQLLAGVGGAFIFYGSKSTQASRNLDLQITNQLTKRQHQLSIMDEVCRARGISNTSRVTQPSLTKKPTKTVGFRLPDSQQIKMKSQKKADIEPDIEMGVMKEETIHGEKVISVTLPVVEQNSKGKQEDQ